MVQLLCRNRVEDYDRWKRVFDRHLESQHESGLRLERLWRSLDEPNNVFFLFEVSDIEKARAFLIAPEAAEAGRVSGVIDGEVHFVEAAEEEA